MAKGRSFKIEIQRAGSGTCCMISQSSEMYGSITMLFVQLEGIYRLWKNEEGFTIDMVESWTQRIHQMLQEQADHMEGAFDNDYAVGYKIEAFLYF